MRFAAPLLLALGLAACCVGRARARATPNPEFDGVPPVRTPLAADDSDVVQSLRFVATELKRLSNRYRYIKLVRCHSAARGEGSFNGSNMFLDLEFDLLKQQPARHDIVVFREKDGSIIGMAIDEFPAVRLHEMPDPDV
ncbi:hypothetical protein T492DRAFT_956780 [Pavlovales sp. CCMP2436]|nr:hypothetical protein T492DRAFT_956780 [Pavlovales sp. CCMP2436]